MNMFLHHNHFLSPYFIFIKEGFKMTDKKILEKLCLKDYELVLDTEERKNGAYGKRYLFLTEDTKWTHLMDDGFYTLWHDEDIRNRIKLLSQDFDIFSCSMGDCDNSFDFIYYEDGELKREFIVEDPNSDGRKIVKNQGNPLQIEELALSDQDAFDIILSIAASLGINIDHDLEKIRCYGRTENESEKFIFDEDED